VQNPVKAAAARSSQYKKGKRFKSPEKTEKTEKRWEAPKPKWKGPQSHKRDDQKRRSLRCRGCGRPSHGEGKSMNRDECPAFGIECLVCHKKKHFAKVCDTDRRESRSNYIRMEGDTTASDSQSDEETDTDYCSADEVVSHHSAVSSLDFRRGRQQGIPG
jgi:hypothetical protein